MKLKRTSKVLALLLSVVMLCSLLPTVALADFNGMTISLSSNEVEAGDEWFVFMQGDGDPIIESEEQSYEIYPEDITDDSGPFIIDVNLIRYDDENFTLTGFIINGVITDPEAYYNDDFGMYDFLYEELDVDDLSDISIEAIFIPKGVSSTYTATVTVLEAEQSMGSIAATEPVFQRDVKDDNETVTASEWLLTAQPAAGCQLAYIEDVRDSTNRVYSEDGKTIKWTVSANTDYTAHFEEATMHYEASSFAYRPLRLSSRVTPSYPGKPISAGQRVGFIFSYSLPSELQGTNTYKFTLYPGTDASAAPLAHYEEEKQSGQYAASYLMTLTVDPVPANLEAVTLALQINDGKIVTETFPVTVQPSGALELRFFSVPSGMQGIYPTNVKTAIGGPNVYDAAAFTDEKTGELSLYLAVSGGVMKYDAAAATDLVYMDGMRFGYNDNEGSSGYVYAIGGPDEAHLAALVKTSGGDFQSGITNTYCVYTCTDGTWTKVEGSELDQSYAQQHQSNKPIGLVIGANDAWVETQHWNGTEWTDSGYTFNSFWKENGSSAYAGSADGLYHYDGTSWTAVSGVSGLVRIDGAARSSSKVVLVSAAEKLITVENGAASVSTIGGREEIVSGNPDSSFLYIGLDEDETLYGVVEARRYDNEGTSGYSGSYVYKQTEGGAWVHQNVAAFNDPNEDSDLDSKIRADGIETILNPCEEVSLFVGKAGAIYAKFATATISFDSNGGSAVSPITQAIGSTVTPPTSPTRENFTFAGWYLSNQDIAMSKAPYTWSVMPAANLTLYAKWRENSSSSGSSGQNDPFAVEKEQAKASLATTLNRLNSSDYDSGTWASIQSAYSAGLSAIDDADSYNDIYNALNAAVDRINVLSQNASGEITVAVTVEKLTVDGGYILEPTLATVKKYSQASVVVTDLLSEKYAASYSGTPWRMTGTVSSSFYLAGIYDPEYNPATSGNNGKNAEGEDFSQTYENFLSEFDGGRWSGWMYCVNGVFPGVGASGWTLQNGDVMRWQYTCRELGGDIGADNTTWGGTSGVSVADKDALIWKVAEINGAGTSSTYGDDYTNAMTVLKNITASQSAVDAALAALNKQDGGNASTGGTGGSGKKDEKTESAGGTTTDSNTVTADDGSQVTTETEKTVETKENDDGSVTETVTEKTTTTVTDPDGKVTATETVVETETTTNSVKNADGTVTETEQTVEKVTETVTAADGTKQTTVTETEETKELNTTTGSDGKVSGTGTYSAKSTVTVDGKTTTAVTEGTVAVSTDDKGTVSEVTTAKTTTTAADGTKTETVAVITEAEMTNGTTGKVVADEAGNTISAEASVSQAAVEAAAKSGEPIEIPVTVNAASGATVSISLEGAGEGSKLWVEIGTTETAPGNVAYLKLAEGVTKLLTTCKTGSVIVPVTGDCEVIVKDNSKSFSDVDAGAWYGDSVKFVTAREIFNGTGNGMFAPSATMNRAMAAQILYNLDGEAKAGDGTSFSDVKADDWFNGAVGWASGLGVITGYDGAYAPLDAVTRQDLVTILYRYAKAAGYDVSAGSVDLTRYADGAEVADYAAEAMRWAISVGLIKGYEDNTLRPTATATRAEVAAIMQRMVQNAVK